LAKFHQFRKKAQPWDIPESQSIHRGYWNDAGHLIMLIHSSSNKAAQTHKLRFICFNGQHMTRKPIAIWNWQHPPVHQITLLCVCVFVEFRVSLCKMEGSKKNLEDANGPLQCSSRSLKSLQLTVSCSLLSMCWCWSRQTSPSMVVVKTK